MFEVVAGDAVADRLRVLLHIAQRQLLERRRRCIEEGERPKHRRARLAAGAARRVANHAGAETHRVPVVRPRQCLGNLRLPAEEIRRS